MFWLRNKKINFSYVLLSGILLTFVIPEYLGLSSVVFERPGKQIAKSKVNSENLDRIYAGINHKNVMIYSFFTSPQIFASPKGRT